MATAAIVLGIGLLLVLALVLPVLTSEAHKSPERSGDADQGSGSVDRTTPPLSQ